MKLYHQRSAFVDPDFEKINQTFLRAQLPMPDLEKEALEVRSGPRTVESIVDHKLWKCRFFPFNVRFRVRFRGAGPSSDGWYHRRQIPHCHQHILSYLAKIQERSPES